MNKSFSCVLKLEWCGEGEPKRLKQRIVLVGSKGSKCLVLSWPPLFTGTSYELMIFVWLNITTITISIISNAITTDSITIKITTITIIFTNLIIITITTYVTISITTFAINIYTTSISRYKDSACVWSSSSAKLTLHICYDISKLMNVVIALAHIQTRQIECSSITKVKCSIVLSNYFWWLLTDRIHVHMCL